MTKKDRIKNLTDELTFENKQLEDNIFAKIREEKSETEKIEYLNSTLSDMSVKELFIVKKYLKANFPAYNELIAVVNKKIDKNSLELFKKYNLETFYKYIINEYTSTIFEGQAELKEIANILKETNLSTTLLMDFSNILETLLGEKINSISVENLIIGSFVKNLINGDMDTIKRFINYERKNLQYDYEKTDSGVAVNKLFPIIRKIVPYKDRCDCYKNILVAIDYDYSTVLFNAKSERGSLYECVALDCMEMRDKNLIAESKKMFEFASRVFSKTKGFGPKNEMYFSSKYNLF